MDNVSEIMLSNLATYQDILETAFAEFLKTRGSSVKTQKNYQSDLRYFFSWVSLTIQSQNSLLPSSHQEFVGAITPHALEQYKHFLVANQIPASTINRRLSALRTFGAFCEAQGWWVENPTHILLNVPHAPRSQNPMEEMLADFRRDLAREGASKVTIRNYASDVRQFLHWMESQE